MHLWLEPIAKAESPFCKAFDAIIIRKFGKDHIFDEDDVSCFEGIDNPYTNSLIRRSAKRMIELLHQHKKVRVWAE